MEHADSTSQLTRTGLRAAALATLVALGAGAHAEGQALRSQEGVAPGHAEQEVAPVYTRLSTNALHLFGDYWFSDPAAGSAPAGLRASTGLVGLTPGAPLHEARAESLQNLPYFGLGYSHLWLTGQLSLNADVGLASQARGRALFGNGNTLEDVVNQVRWAPVMAVNMRYAF